jgi:hypothetical protein
MASGQTILDLDIMASGLKYPPWRFSTNSASSETMVVVKQRTGKHHQHGTYNTQEREHIHYYLGVFVYKFALALADLPRLAPTFNSPSFYNPFTNLPTLFPAE